MKSLGRSSSDHQSTGEECCRLQFTVVGCIQHPPEPREVDGPCPISDKDVNLTVQENAVGFIEVAIHAVDVAAL